MDAGWTPVMRRQRRKKSAWREDGDDNGNSNIKLNLIEERSLVRNREVNRIPEIFICGSLQASRWVAVKPTPFSSKTRTKIK